MPLSETDIPGITVKPLTVREVRELANSHRAKGAIVILFDDLVVTGSSAGPTDEASKNAAALTLELLDRITNGQVALHQKIDFSLQVYEGKHEPPTPEERN